MNKFRILSVFTIGLFTASLSFAQKKITGKVLDKETGEALIGVHLFTPKGESTITDIDGNYRLTVLPNDTLKVSYIGYETLSIPFGKLQSRMNIQLIPGIMLKEVTVTASIASARSSKSIGADVARVNAAQLLEKGQANNLSEMLDGRVSGVQLYQSNGKVGMPIRFNMRSGATLSMDRDPIIYVDGVRYNNSHTSDINSSQDALSALNDLPMEDIAGIDIIKGPAAAASYGAEAANGVIVITTKRQQGKEQGKLNAGVKFTQGFSQLARKYNQFVNNEDLNNFFVTGHQTNLFANVSKSFSPGNRIYFSINESQNTGIVPGNKDKRHHLRTAYDLRQDRFFMNLSVAYTNGSISLPQTAQGRNDAIWNLMRTQEPWQYVSERTWRAQKWSYDNDRIIGAIKMGYTLPYEIKLETQLGIDLNFIKGIYRLPYGYLLGANDQGIKNISQRRNANLNWDWKISKQFDLRNKWKATATLLSQIARRYEAVHRIESSMFSGDVDNVSAATKQTTYENDFEQRTWGLYAETFFNYDNRFFINAGLRRDASNLIGANVTSIYYPSLSLSYNVGNWKLRTAYGESGRLPYPTDARTAYIMSGTSAYGAIVKPSTKGNPNIRPERMREWEAGMDLYTKKHQLSLTAYAQFTTDAIIYVPLLSSNGWVGNEPRNIGKVRGFGAEMSWNWSIWKSLSEKNAVNFFATVNYQTNKVTDTGGQTIENLPNVIRKGEPAYAFFYKEVTGADYDKNGKYKGAKESDEYHYLGKPFPDVNGAFGFDVRFLRDWTFSTKFSYAIGASVYNQTMYNVAGLGDNYKKREDLKKALALQTIGSPEYIAVAEKLALTERRRANFIENADFLRMSSLSLSYDASSLLRKQTNGFIKGGRIQVTAQNLFLLTNYSGIEPQVEANGGTRQTRGIGSLSRDITNTPSPRTFTFTLSCDF